MILGLIFGLVLIAELALVGYGILWCCGAFRETHYVNHMERRV